MLRSMLALSSVAIATLVIGCGSPTPACDAYCEEQADRTEQSITDSGSTWMDATGTEDRAAWVAQCEQSYTDSASVGATVPGYAASINDACAVSSADFTCSN